MRCLLLVLVTSLATLVGPTAAPPARAAADSACARTAGPFAVGTTTLSVRSRGERVPITVAYPAASPGEGARPACRRSALVVAGHGAQGDGASAAALHGYLVQRGYVVAAPTFARDFDIRGFAHDVGRTITHVRRASGRGSGPLAGRVRTRGEVGYIGTSMGAIVGLALVDRDGRDRRIGAVVAKAGSWLGGSFDTAGGPPVLMLNGDADTTIRYDGARATYRELGRPKGLVTLRGVGHDLNTGRDPILTETSRGFLDRFVRGRRDGLTRVVRAVERSGIATLRRRW